MSGRRKIVLGIVSSITLFLLIGTVIFSPEITKFLFSRDKTSFCATGEIPYDIGTVDAEFGVSKEEFTEAVKKAEALWESALQKNVFVEKSSGARMEINLVFDERQAETLALKKKIEGIKSTEEKYKTVQNEYLEFSSRVKSLAQEIDSLKDEYSSLRNELLSLNAVYDAKVKNFESRVAYWNDHGGASKPEYDKLTVEKNELDALYEQIKTKEEELKTLESNLNEKIAAYNALASQVNTIAGMINRLASSLNVGIKDYNRLQTDREEFVTGSYKIQNNETSIDVYQFYDDKDLVIILAHEMGHALGVPHAAQENSIMYPRITNQEIKISEEDISLLKSICAPNELK
ncbi:MAG: matrixin family metalloprotease [Parcubacteria group bacterium]